MRAEVGDIVHVKAVVQDKSSGGKRFYVKVDTYAPDSCIHVWVAESAIVHVDPRPLQVGDRVAANDLRGVILALTEKYAWVDEGGPNPYTYPLSRLRKL